MPDIEEDFELVGKCLGQILAVQKGSSAMPEASPAELHAAFERIREAWPKSHQFPIRAEGDKPIFDTYSAELGEGSVHVSFVAYPGKLPTVEAAYDLGRRQGEALRKLADAFELAGAGALAAVNTVKAARGEPS